MPVDYSKYHPRWKKISQFIRFYRAQNHCEHCGVKNYSKGYWVDGIFWTVEAAHDHLSETGIDVFQDIPEDKPPVKIVLTVAHLDHDIHNNSFFNLAALCQRCHLNHDRLDNLRRRREKRFKNQL
ncbi:MAG: hypothetical protein AAFO07_30795, partial [Bacteroidota bacterium]